MGAGRRSRRPVDLSSWRIVWRTSRGPGRPSPTPISQKRRSAKGRQSTTRRRCASSCTSSRTRTSTVSRLWLRRTKRRTRSSSTRRKILVLPSRFRLCDIKPAKGDATLVLLDLDDDGAYYLANTSDVSEAALAKFLADPGKRQQLKSP